MNQLAMTGCLGVALGLMLCACDGKTSSPPAAAGPSGPSGPPPARVTTPLTKDPAATDVAIAAEIRRRISADTTLSPVARDCKIQVQSGVVSLHGQVASQAEKDNIESKARRAPGVTSVDNQLQIATS